MGKYDHLRKDFQRFKSMTNEQFWTEMNIMHTRAYAACQRQYHEAMDIELQPKQKAAVVKKATEIRELWDKMATLTTDDTKEEVFEG